MLILEHCISIFYLSPVIYVLWFLHLPVDFSATSWIIFTYLWFLCFSSCNWGVPVWHTGALDECMSSVWGIRWAVARPRSAQGWCLLPKWLESTSLSSRHAATLKPVAQVEASGQGNGPFSREDWGCVFQPTVVQGLRLEILPRIIYLIVTVPRSPRKQASVATRAGGPESRHLLYTRCGLCDLLALARLQECWGQDTWDGHWRAGKPGALAGLGESAGVWVSVAITIQQHVEGGEECWEQSKPAALLRLCPHLCLHKWGTRRMQEWHSAMPPSPGKAWVVPVPSRCFKMSK